MRTTLTSFAVVIGFTIAACLALPVAHATDVVDDDPAATASDDTTSERKQSGFGMVMGVLTQLLQDAAMKEAAGQPSRNLSMPDSAVTITVTPVEGRTSLRGNPRSGDKRDRNDGDDDPRVLAGGPH